ncbi:MAG: XrtA system polysaccharide deacetylase [Aquisalimonadaceae bacterium]
MHNALSIDVEDFFHVTALREAVRPEDWGRFELRVERTTHRLLDLFDEVGGVFATFFVLGWIAERCPRLVREIAARGHEIGSHGYSHQLIYQQTPIAFEEETRRSRALLEDQVQMPVTGYRAASYSITRDSLWALDALVELGFTWDSSIFPVRHDRYGIPGARRWPHRLMTPSGYQLTEFPLSTWRLGPVNLPVAGGGYFRLYPYPVTRSGLRRINLADGQPFIFYLHPWEIDPEQPRVPVGGMSRFRHYHNLHKCEGRLRRLLNDFAFTTVGNVLCEHALSPEPRVSPPPRPAPVIGRVEGVYQRATKSLCPAAAPTANAMVAAKAVTSSRADQSPVARVELMGIDSAAAWDGYVASRTAQASAYHAYAWRRVVEQVFGHECHYWMARNPEGRVCGVLPLVRLRSRLFGDFAVSLPFVNYGGCVADSRGIRRQLVGAACDQAGELGLDHLELRESAPLDGRWPTRTDKVIMLLDLPADPDVLWRRLGSKVRAQVKRPQREGVTAEVGGEELLAAFYSVFARNMRDLGTPVYSSNLFRQCLRQLPNVHVAVVRLAGRPVAAGLLVGHGLRLEIPWASSLRDYGRLGVNMLLYWQCLEFAINRKYEIFDFGRSSVDSGTFRFKKQWGAEPVKTHWHYWLPEGKAMPALRPDNPRYDIAIRLWKRLPVPVTRLVGPHIVKYLP